MRTTRPIHTQNTQTQKQAAREEGFDLDLPRELAVVDTVGRFQGLVDLAEGSAEVKHKVCVRVCIYLPFLACVCGWGGGAFAMCTRVFGA